MAECKTAVTPLLMQWSYCSLAISHWNKMNLPLGNKSACVSLSLAVKPRCLWQIFLKIQNPSSTGTHTGQSKKKCSKKVTNDIFILCQNHNLWNCTPEKKITSYTIRWKLKTRLLTCISFWSWHQKCSEIADLKAERKSHVLWFSKLL